MNDRQEVARHRVNQPVATVQYGCSVNQANRVELLRARCEAVLSAGDGDVVEVGVYRGGTLVVLAGAIQKVCPDRRVIGVDTFQGHPYSDGHWVHPVGKYSDVAVRDLDEMLRRKGLSPYVSLEIGLAEDVLPRLDLGSVVFAHIDCDLYRSVRFCASYLPRRMSEQGVLFFDDFCHEHCPGATQAVIEEFGQELEPIRLDDGTEWSCEVTVASWRARHGRSGGSK
jgi:O-methyltransferase